MVFARLSRPDTTARCYQLVWLPSAEVSLCGQVAVRGTTTTPAVGVYAKLTSHPQRAALTPDTTIAAPLTAVLTGPTLRDLVLSE